MRKLIIISAIFASGLIFLSAQNPKNTVSSQKEALQVQQPQNQPEQKPITNPPKAQLEDFPERASFRTLSEIWFSLSVLVFGFLVILLEIYLIMTRKLSADDSIKFVTVTLVVTGALFLIAAGFSNNQIAPAIGLLGTIAGYLLGKGTYKAKESGDSEASKNE